jgi:tRNA-2-methylthio-N6-dimethylallyladenosine synthase
MKSYYIITIGCHMNQADSERIESFLSENKYQALDNYIKADLVILTTCGIRQAAEDRVYGLVNQIRKTNPKVKIVITGCLANREDVQKRLKGKVDLFMPINELPNLLVLLNNINHQSSNSQTELRRLSGEKYLGITPKYYSSFTAYVPIGNGCNNFCSYCVVPYARGREVYRASSDIIKEVENLLAKGYKEIVLIAQNVNSYRSGRIDFPLLLKKIASLPGDFWLRFFSSHPKDLSDELIRVMSASDKICHHLHLAVQSGDDDILQAMNRRYKAEHFISLIEKIRQAKPGIAISTDVIVGFPGETKKQFQNTAKLFKKLKFDMAYISQYSPRPGTVAWKMKDNVSELEKKERELILENILRQTSLKINQDYIGRVLKVLVDHKTKKGIYQGKTSSFKSVQFSSPQDLIGRFALVRIKAVKSFGLSADLLEVLDDNL